MLGVAPINSAADAVRAAIVADHKQDEIEADIKASKVVDRPQLAADLRRRVDELLQRFAELERQNEERENDVAN